jgi:hypothetical protein
VDAKTELHSKAVTVKDYYLEAILNGWEPLELLIDFVVNEKKTVRWDEEAEQALALYTLPKHRDKMNHLVKEYKERRDNCGMATSSQT